MKDWIKNLNDEELARLYKDTASLKDVPPALRERALARLKAESAPKAAGEKRAAARPRFLMPALALAAAVILAGAAFVVLPPLLKARATTAAVNDSDLQRGFVGVSGGQALVTYAAGDVRVRAGDAWSPVEIGALLERGQALKTGPASSCSLQFGDRAVVLVEERTEIAVGELLLKTDASAVTVRVETGAVLARVKQLAGGERFQVRTRNAVCGVRGTEFLVEVNERSDARVAVSEGSVYVLPARLDPADLAAGPGRLPALGEQLKAAAPKVEAGRELELASAQNAAFETPYAPLIERVETATRQGALSDEAAENMRGMISSSTSAAAASLPAARPLSDADSTRLLDLAGISFLPARVREGGAGGEGGQTAAGPALVKVDVSVEPAEARIFVGDRPVGSGRFEGIYAAGESLRLSARLGGYEDAERTVTVEAGAPNVVTLLLKAKANAAAGEEGEGETAAPSPNTPAPVKNDPIAAVSKPSGAGFIGDLAASGGLVFGADKNGVVYAVNGSGETVWTLATANAPNTNSSPVAIDGRIYFSGLRELVIAEAVSGRLLARVPLEASANGMFGRRVVKAGADLVLPTDTSLRIIDPASGATVKEYRLPGDSRMTPTFYNGKAYVVDSMGAVQAVDARTGRADPQPLRTDAVEPIAISLAVAGGRGYIAGRKNLLVCIDLAAGKLLWQKQLTAAGYAYNDLVAWEGGVAVYAGRTLFGYSPAGQALWKPIAAVSAPPLLSGGSLYAGTADGRLLALDPATGTVRKTLNLKKVIAARPAAFGKLIALGTETGEIVLVNPADL